MSNYGGLVENVETNFTFVGSNVFEVVTTNTAFEAGDWSFDADVDADGLNNLYEFYAMLNPLTPDSDLDGVGDNADVFPNDATETLDSDLDGVGNNADAFPTDAGETQVQKRCPGPDL